MNGFSREDCEEYKDYLKSRKFGMDEDSEYKERYEELLEFIRISYDTICEMRNDLVDLQIHMLAYNIGKLEMHHGALLTLLDDEDEEHDPLTP